MTRYTAFFIATSIAFAAIIGDGSSTFKGTARWEQKRMRVGERASKHHCDDRPHDGQSYSKYRKVFLTTCTLVTTIVCEWHQTKVLAAYAIAPDSSLSGHSE